MDGRTDVGVLVNQLVAPQNSEPSHVGQRGQLIEVAALRFQFRENRVQTVHSHDLPIKSLSILLRFYQTQYQKDTGVLLAGLDELAEVHICFQLLRLDWRYRLERAQRCNVSALTDLLPRKELTHIPSTIDTMQKQILQIFQKVLDADGGKKTQRIPERMAAYYNQHGDDPLNTFQFRVLPLKFEAVNESAFTEVLYPNSIYDLIDYALRECLQREQRMRLCKNCGQYFALTGRGTAEYCDITVDEKGRTYKEMGAINHWTRSKADDEAFQLYRREYKRRFAWSKTGKLSPRHFMPGVSWPERTRRSAMRGRLRWRSIRLGCGSPDALSVKLSSMLKGAGADLLRPLLKLVILISKPNRSRRAPAPGTPR